MNKALLLAKKSFQKNEVPIGAIIVNPDNKIIGRGYNKAEKSGCQTAHAEIEAIKKACSKIGGWRLNGCKIYVTLEPCVMCFGLIRLSRISELIYAAPSTLFGFSKSIDLPDQYPGNLSVISSLKEEESLAIIKEFFELARVREGRKL